MHSIYGYAILAGFDSRLIEQNPAGRTPVCYLGPAFGGTYVHACINM